MGRGVINGCGFRNVVAHLGKVGEQLLRHGQLRLQCPVFQHGGRGLQPRLSGLHRVPGAMGGGPLEELVRWRVDTVLLILLQGDIGQCFNGLPALAQGLSDQLYLLSCIATQLTGTAADTSR